MRALLWQRYCGTGVSTVLLSGCSASGLAHIALPGVQGALSQVPWRRLGLMFPQECTAQAWDHLCLWDGMRSTGHGGTPVCETSVGRTMGPAAASPDRNWSWKHR